MADLLTSAQKLLFTGLFASHFETFSSGINRTITVYKEPIKIVNQTNPGLFGYENTSEEENITYTEQKQTFYAIITYNDKQTENTLLDANTAVPEGLIRVKVDSVAKNYINNGKNLFAEVDGKKYNFDTRQRVQNYLGKEYYIYFLKETD